MDFIEKIINDIEKEASKGDKKKVIVDSPLDLVVLQVTRGGKFVDGTAERIADEIYGRELVTSSFVPWENEVYFVALCKR